MAEWLEQYGALLGWIGFLSLVTGIASAVLVPWWIVRLPADYLNRAHHEYTPLKGRGPLKALLALGKNLLGLLLIAAGVVMLFLPGQGLLAIFIGILVIECPGKHRMVRWVGTRPAIWHSANWLRKRAGKPPFVVDPE